MTAATRVGQTPLLPHPVDQTTTDGPDSWGEGEESRPHYRRAVGWENCYVQLGKIQSAVLWKPGV